LHFLAIAHCADRRRIPMKIRPHVRTALAAPRAGELPFDVGQPHVVGPPVGAECLRVAALVIGAINHDALDAGRAHFAEDYLGRSFHSLFSTTGVDLPSRRTDQAALFGWQSSICPSGRAPDRSSRIASGRVIVGACLAIQVSNAFICLGCRRTPTRVPLPVGGGPRRFFVIKVRLSWNYLIRKSCELPLARTQATGRVHLRERAVNSRPQRSQVVAPQLRSVSTEPPEPSRYFSG